MAVTEAVGLSVCDLERGRVLPEGKGDAVQNLICVIGEELENSCLDVLFPMARNRGCQQKSLRNVPEHSGTCLRSSRALQKFCISQVISRRILSMSFQARDDADRLVVPRVLLGTVFKNGCSASLLPVAGDFPELLCLFQNPGRCLGTTSANALRSLRMVLVKMP